MASATAAANPEAPPVSPIVRLGEQVSELVIDIGGVAQFSAVTIMWLFRLCIALERPHSQFLYHWRIERIGRGDYRDVYRDGIGCSGV